MTDHLSVSLLNALVDGELTPAQLSIAQEHLNNCPACTSEALAQTLLKNAVARSGRRHVPSPEFIDRMNGLMTAAPQHARPENHAINPPARIGRKARAVAYSGWATAAVLLLMLASSFLLLRPSNRNETALAANSSLVTELTDLHVAMLAVNQPPQVLSSDRHTVKPWFEGKIPFAFNLPDNLPEDTKLEGANLVFVHGAPVAQLIYSIGRHRGSVFVRERTSASDTTRLMTERSGFQIASLETAELDVIAMTDADRSHLTGLVSAFERAQTNAPAPKP
jgi:anti-sigma factor RsiW